MIIDEESRPIGVIHSSVVAEILTILLAFDFIDWNMSKLGGLTPIYVLTDSKSPPPTYPMSETQLPLLIQNVLDAYV